MEYKLFHTPRHHDEEWYKDREAADHIHQEGGHRMRLLEALELVERVVECDNDHVFPGTCVESVADWGAGNGGLLSELSKKWQGGMRAWGYDLCPANVEYGVKRYGLDLQLMNITFGSPLPADIVVLTELLEHLVNPHLLLERLSNLGTRWLVASTPGFEDYTNFYEYHLWAWTEDSFAKMFERAGFRIHRHFTVALCGTQFLVASKTSS